MRRRYFNYFNSRLFNNKIIIYTSADNLIVVPYRYNFGANAITNIINNNIGKITFDGDVTTIGYYAFFDCTSLTSVNIPDSVTTIGQDAFYNCDSLTSVTIPDSVKTIGVSAFEYCDRLTSVYCKATTPPALDGRYVFDKNASGRKIYVPEESVDAYKSAAYWREYADAIVGYDFENDVVVDESGSDGNEITFYIDDLVDVIPMKALSGMTWEEFVNSEYANQNSAFTNFRLFAMGSYDGIKFYHEGAMQDLILYHNIGVPKLNVRHTDIIEDGKTYYAN